MLLLIDIVLGDSFNLYQIDSEFQVNAFGVFILMIFSYVLNNSLSALFNYISRFFLWGKIREYFIYRKLDVFKEKEFSDKKYSCITFIINYEDIKVTIDKNIVEKTDSLYFILLSKLRIKNVPDASIKTVIDIYDVVRTLVMASKDNSIIDWIKYHWDQLRLARSTIMPSFILIVLTPFLLVDWNCDIQTIIIGEVIIFLFFILQYFHYFYRERFMIYTLFGYFINEYI